MKRRHRVPKDSLDLLLDTMCNAFGGIVLIAILVALLIEKPGDGELHDTPMTREDLILSRKAAELSRLEQEIKTTEVELEENRKLINLIKKKNQLMQTLENRQESEALSMVGLNEKLGALLEEKSNLLNQITALTSEVLALETTLAEEQATRKRLDKEMEELIASRTSGTRPPELRDASGRQLNIIIKHGEIFPLSNLKFDDSGKAYAFVEDDSAINWDGDVAIPIKNSGLTLESDIATLKRMFAEISRHNRLFPSRPSERFYIIFFVYQDSFELITPLREMVQTAGSLQDGWEPKTMEAVLAFSSDGERSQTD